MLSLLSKKPKVTSLTETDFMLAFTKHWFDYAAILISLIPKDALKFLITNEIFKLVMHHGGTVLLMSLFGKSSKNIQQSVIEDLLNHLASFEEFNNFVIVLNTEIANPKLITNGETLLTKLLKEKNLKYCWAMINSSTNKKCIVLPNQMKETPLQIAIEREFFDLINPIIFNCDEQFNWDDSLIALLQKLSILTNTVFNHYFRCYFID